MVVHVDPRYEGNGRISVYDDYIDSKCRNRVLIDLKEDRIKDIHQEDEVEEINLSDVRNAVYNEINSENRGKVNAPLVEIITAVKIIEWYNIEEVVVHCGYYGYNCEYIVAAKIMGIKAVEIQHGALYDYEGVAYNFREDLSEDPIRRILYPDELIVWGEYWTRQVSGHIKYRAMDIRKKYIHDARKDVYEYKRDVILLIANRIDDKYYEDQISIIHKGNGECKIGIRFHPWIWRDRTDYISEIKDLYQDKNIFIIEQQEELKDSLKVTKAVYSPRSTIVFECYALGIETRELKCYTDFEHLSFRDYTRKNINNIFKGVQELNRLENG